MDSPVFSRSNVQVHWSRLPAPGANDVAGQADYLLAKLTLQREIRTLFASLKKLVTRRKKEGWLLLDKQHSRAAKTQDSIHNKKGEGSAKAEGNKVKRVTAANTASECPTSVVICTLETRDKLSAIGRILRLNLTRRVCQAWMRLRQTDIGSQISENNPLRQPRSKDSKQPSPDKSMSQLKCKAQAQLPEEWKENSIQNVSDIAIENQRLKKEILSEEYECERFVEKMKELLDAHDKGGLCRTTSKHGYHSIMPPGKKK